MDFLFDTSTSVYKVNYLLENNVIDTIIVFYGSSPEISNPSELFKSDPMNNAFVNKNTGIHIFNDEELTAIKDKNIKVRFSTQQIHFDDSIGTIKLKILNEYDRKFSFEEIYLFCMKEEFIDAVSVYQSVTQNKKIELTRVRLEQFLLNIVRSDNGFTEFDLPEKDFYTYDDILALNIHQKPFWISNVLGQKYFLVENEYPFVINPFDVTEYDPFFEKSSRKYLSTLNNRLLLNTGKIIGNNIYLCLAQDVLNRNIHQEYTLKIYFPFLFVNNVNSLDDLNEKRPEYIEDNKKKYNDKIQGTFNSIDMFYDIYKYKKNNLVYISSGIKVLKLIIKNEYDLKMPLDVIFKILHSTIDVPLIKFNTSARQENIYRLYTDKTSTDGRKIPYLNKATILKLTKNIGKTKSVALFIELRGIHNPIICEFDDKCNITISLDFDKSISIQKTESIIRDGVNPIIAPVIKYLQQNGFNLGYFVKLAEPNVEIKQIDYQCKLDVKKALNISKLKGCITSAFVIEEESIKKGIEMRFKRVSNFNKRTSEEAFIIGKLKGGVIGDELVDDVIKNFELSRTDAEILIVNVERSIHIEKGTRRGEIEIKENPGFKTNITLDKINLIATIDVLNINDINYLYTVPIYLDSLMRLTQDKSSTSFPENEINKLCSHGERVDVVINDIIAPSEKSINEVEQDMDFEDDSVINQYELENIKNAMNLFFGEDYEDIENDENVYNEQEQQIEGGKINESDDGYESSDNDDIEESPSVIDEGSISPIVEQEILQSPSVDEGSISPIVEQEILQSPSVDEGSISPIVEQEILPSPSVDEAPIPQQEEIPSIDMGSISPVIEKKEPYPMNVPEKEPENKFKKTKAEPEEYTEKNIDGMKLNNPYFFQDRIKQREPTLILTKKKGNYNSYSRVCSSNLRRQPVILNQKEKDKIDNDYKGFLKDEDVIKYGSTPDNQYYYICPRYWCLKTNSVISEEDVNAGKCGKIINNKDKVVKPGHYVYEFYTSPKNKKEYKRYPNFQKDSHPDGYCLPCCFDKWNTDEMVKRKKQCSGEEPSKENVAKTAAQETNKGLEDTYIKGPEKFPLDKSRWGYLPVSLQMILHEVNADCKISDINTNIKENYACLLRHGVELNETQSFIACIADSLFFARRTIDKVIYNIPSITEMKNIIIESLTLDNFIKYQNGNLVADFKTDVYAQDISQYVNTTTYSKLNINNKIDKEYFSKIVASFENFIKFMKDEEIIIDHTYLWDIICNPNKNMFISGVNLVIFEIVNNDITNNVELVCPTNHYATSFYESRKPTLILIKDGNYFEPIYSYKKVSKKIFIGKTFSEYDPSLSKTVMAVLKKIIKPTIQNKCVPLSSMPSVYISKKPVLLHVLIQILHRKKYEVVKQVVNYSNKVIGVIAENRALRKLSRGFIPCYPSAIIYTYDHVYMIDKGLWDTYPNTIEFLMKIAKTTEIMKNPTTAQIIPCKPVFKIVEDLHVVGVLTETNQFIQLSEPFLLTDTRDDIPVLYNSNYAEIDKVTSSIVVADNVITTTHEIDNERDEYIKKLKLEANFYNVFRNTVKLLLNDYANIKIRERIEIELNKSYMLYSQKLSTIDNLLQQISLNKIEFTGNADFYKKINEVSTCLNKTKPQCSESAPLCVTRGVDNDCTIILPLRHLITNNMNKPLYYGKMADELIRFSRITNFVLHPQTYLSFGNINYSLNESEILIIQSMITKEYFEGFIPIVYNKYSKYNSRDEATPLKTVQYDTEVDLDVAINPSQEKTCDHTVTNKIKSSIWKKCFPADYTEIEYGKTNYCTFYFIIELLKKTNNITININELKLELYNEYVKYLPLYKDKIIDILIIEGKKTLGDQVKAGSLSFTNFIYTDSYFMTTLDIWLIIEKYKIPCVFISSKFLLETNYKKNSFVGHGTKTDPFIFIVIPGLRPENIPSYKIIQNVNKDVFIGMNNLKSRECENALNYAFDNSFSVEDYLKSFSKESKTNYRKKIPKDEEPYIGEDGRINKRIWVEKVPEQVEKKKRVKLKIIESVEQPAVEIPEIIKLTEPDLTEVKPKRRTKKKNVKEYIDKKKTKKLIVK